MRSTGGHVLGSANERGSALLIVFVFAAIIAIMLYTEMPVNVFEAQRNKEQLLVDRGNEYAHAVKLYYRKFGIFPPTMDALENTNRMRFLRRKFKDPYTGENDWRILHAGPAGGLIDSKVNNGGTLNGLSGNNPGSTGSFGGSSNSNSAFGSGNSGSGTSNSGFGNGNSGFGNSNSGFGNSKSGFGNSGSGSSNSSSSGSGFGFSGYSGGWSGGSSSSGVPGQAGANPAIPQRKPAVSASSGAPGQTAGTAPGTSSDPTAPLLASSSGQNGANGEQGNGATGAGAQNGSELNAQSGGDKAAVPGNAEAGVRGLLTNPNGRAEEGNGVVTASQGGSTSVETGNASQGVIAGGGIAGVASKVDGHSIKVINEKTNYSLWEFYYDPTKDATKGLAAAGQQGVGQVNGQNATNGIASPTLQNSFGNTPGNNSQNGGSPDANATGNGNANPQQTTPPQ